VACVKDFPGSWAEYRVYEGGIMQIHRRIDAPDALAWTELTRGMFGGLYPDYAFGSIGDRCFVIRTSRGAGALLGGRDLDAVLVPLAGRSERVRRALEQLPGVERVRRVAGDAGPQRLTRVVHGERAADALDGPHRAVLGGVLEDEREAPVVEPAGGVRVAQRRP